ncbi:MAG: PIN domain-containing protein [Polyangiaceae bacterium]|nr:PIN domain-containing protein [Polyangiaceae bacterium]
MRTVILDTGPLVALLNRRERQHAWASRVLDLIEPPVFTCDAVLSEACFLLRTVEGGSDAVLELVARGIVRSDFRVTGEIGAVRALMKKFRDVPMSLADACLVRMTELDPQSAVLTLDSDFGLYRRNRRQLVPIISPGKGGG